MVWMATQQLAVGGKRRRIWGGAFLCWVLLMLVTPKISHSPKHHLYADMSNFLGVPNTLNVITSFPFLVVGVLDFVLCVQGGLFNIRRGLGLGAILCWNSRGSFGSAYYHLKPDDGRVAWDTLPMMIAYSSLFSSFIVERVGERIGLSYLFALLFIAFLSIAYDRTCNDIRLYTMFQLIPCIAIPTMSSVFPPKYTHSRYWLWAAGKADMKAFSAQRLSDARKLSVNEESLEIFSSCCFGECFVGVVNQMLH